MRSILLALISVDKLAAGAHNCNPFGPGSPSPTQLHPRKESHVRRICIILVTILLLACLASAQQTASDVSTNSQTRPSPPDTVTGSGTEGYIPIWTTPTNLGNSTIYQALGKVGIGNTLPIYQLDVDGDTNTSGVYRILGQNVLSAGPRTSQGNIFVGVGPGYTGTASYQDILVGLGAGHEITSGNQNAFVGYHAGYQVTTGLQNSYFGDFAGEGNTTGSRNTFLGTGVGVYNNSTGSNNVYIGNDAGIGTTGNDNVAIGERAGLGNSNGSNDIYIGEGAGCDSFCTESKTIRIGTQGTQSAAYLAGIYGVNVDGIPVQINSNGQLGVATSSLRFKEQIRDMGDSTEALIKLRPVTFLYKPEYANGERTLQYGLIAEEVAKVYPELVAYDQAGRPYSVRYQYLSTMLLNEVQQQYHRAEGEAEIVKAQEQRIEQLEKRLSRLEDVLTNQAKTVAEN